MPGDRPQPRPRLGVAHAHGPERLDLRLLVGELQDHQELLRHLLLLAAVPAGFLQHRFRGTFLGLQSRLQARNSLRVTFDRFPQSCEHGGVVVGQLRERVDGEQELPGLVVGDIQHFNVDFIVGV
jgi:hypothetical protein